MTALGNFVRARRKQLGMLQVQLASRMGVDDTYVSAIETGKRTPDSVDFLDALARALELDGDRVADLMRAAQVSQRIFRLPTETSSRKRELLKVLAEDIALTETDIEAIAAVYTAISQNRRVAITSLNTPTPGGSM